MLGPDRHRQAAVEHGTQQADHHQLLLQDGEHGADGLHRVEGHGELRGPAHVHLLGTRPARDRAQGAGPGGDDPVDLPTP